MPQNSTARKLGRILGAAALVFTLGATVASAQNFPSGRDAGSTNATR